MPKRESVFFEEGTVKFDSFLTQNKFDVFFKSFVNWLRNANMNPLPGSFSKRKSNLIVWKLPFKAADSATIFNYEPVGDGARPERRRARPFASPAGRGSGSGRQEQEQGEERSPLPGGRPAAPGSH